MDGPVAIGDLLGDHNLRPVARLGETMSLCGDLFGDLYAPNIAVVGLDVGEHASVGIICGVAARDELAEAFGAEVVGDASSFV